MTSRAADGGLLGVADTRLRPLADRLTSTPLIPAVVAAALGLFTIGSKSIWVDEGISIAIARMPTLQMLPYVALRELHASPYYLVLHPWLALSQSEAAIRSLSVLFGVLAVLATWAIGKRYGVAFKAALLMAVLPALVTYMQQAKGYTMLAATSALSTWLLLRLIDRPTRWRALAYIASAVVIAYVHPVGGLIAVAQAGIVLVYAAPAVRARLMLVFVPIVLSWIPIAIFAVKVGDKFAWIPAATPDVVAMELIALAGGVLVAIALVMALVLGFRRDALAIWLLVPVAGAFVASWLVEPVFRHPYLLGVLPAAALIAARAPRVLVAAIVVLALVANWSWYQAPSIEDWRGAAGYVAAQVQAGDGIVLAPAYVRPAFGYYARVGEPLLPSIPWTASDTGYAAPDDARLSAATRIWLVESDLHGPVMPANVAAELTRRPVLSEHDFDGQIRVLLLGAGAPLQAAGLNQPADTLAGQ